MAFNQVRFVFSYCFRNFFQFFLAPAPCLKPLQSFLSAVKIPQDVRLASMETLKGIQGRKIVRAIPYRGLCSRGSSLSRSATNDARVRTATLVRSEALVLLQMIGRPFD